MPKISTGVIPKEVRGVTNSSGLGIAIHVAHRRRRWPDAVRGCAGMQPTIGVQPALGLLSSFAMTLGRIQNILEGGRHFPAKAKKPSPVSGGGLLFRRIASVSACRRR